MKSTLLCYFLLSAAINADPGFAVADVNVRIESLVASKAHLTNSALDVEGRNSNLDFIAIKNLAVTSWSPMIDQMDQLAQGGDGKRLVIQALQVLNAEDFMSAFEKLVAKFEADTLSKELMEDALYPDWRMKTFFAYNFQHPRVILALGKIKSKLPQNDPLVETINDLLSGERKASFESYRKAHEDTTEPPKPIIMLPPAQ